MALYTILLNSWKPSGYQCSNNAKSAVMTLISGPNSAVLQHHSWREAHFYLFFLLAPKK